MEKMKFIRYNFNKEQYNKLQEVCPLNTFKVASPQDFPITNLPKGLVEKTFKLVVCGSGDTSTSVVYMVNFIRPDQKDFSVDQEPLIIAYHNNRYLTAGFIHHGDWPGRTVYPGSGFFQAISASGIMAYYPYVGIPDKEEGQISDLTPDSQKQAFWNGVKLIKKE